MKMIITDSRERSLSPSSDRCKYSRRKISRWVNSVGAVEPKCHPYGNNTEPNSEYSDAGTVMYVVLVCYSKDTDKQQSSAQNLKQRNTIKPAFALSDHIKQHIFLAFADSWLLITA